MSNDWRNTNYEYAVCYIYTLSKHEYVYGNSVMVKTYSDQIPINNHKIEKVNTRYFEEFIEMNGYIEEKKEFMSDSCTISFIDINRGEQIPKAQ